MIIETIIICITVIVVMGIIYKISDNIIKLKFPKMSDVYETKINELEQRIQKLEVRTVYERTKNQI